MLVYSMAALLSIVLRYAGAHSHTCFVLSFPFVSLEMSLFPSIFCTIAVFSLYGEYVVRSLLPEVFFLPCDHVIDISSCKNSDIKNRYNGGLLPDIILLTLCDYIREPLQPMVPPKPFD